MAEQNGEGVHKAGEYEALMQGMAMVQKMGGKAVEMFSDSRLVVGQVTGKMEAKDVRMQEYLNQVKLSILWWLQY